MLDLLDFFSNLMVIIFYCAGSVFIIVATSAFVFSILDLDHKFKDWLHGKCFREPYTPICDVNRIYKLPTKDKD